MRIDLLEVPYFEDLRRFWKLGFLLLGFDDAPVFLSWESQVVMIFLVVERLGGVLGLARVLNLRGWRNEEDSGIKEVAMVWFNIFGGRLR